MDESPGPVPALSKNASPSTHTLELTRLNLVSRGNVVAPVKGLAHEF